MTHSPNPRSTPRPRRANADYRWTRSKALAFLDALAATGEISTAAHRVGMSRQSAYRLKARFGPGKFADAWDAAQRAGRARKVTRKVTPEGPR